jgi:hypothetical protein
MTTVTTAVRLHQLGTLCDPPALFCASQNGHARSQQTRTRAISERTEIMAALKYRDKSPVGYLSPHNRIAPLGCWPYTCNGVLDVARAYYRRPLLCLRSTNIFPALHGIVIWLHLRRDKALSAGTHCSSAPTPVQAEIPLISVIGGKVKDVVMDTKSSNARVRFLCC